MMDPRIAKIYRELTKDREENEECGCFESAVLEKLDEIIIKLDEIKEKLDDCSSNSSWLFGNEGPEI